MYDNYIHIPLSRVKYIIKTSSTKKFNKNAIKYISAVICLMSHEFIEIILNYTLFNNKYIITIQHLYNSIIDPKLIKSSLTINLFINLPVIKYIIDNQKLDINPENVSNEKLFINYINRIKLDVLQEHQNIIGTKITPQKQIQLSKNIKSVITMIIFQHIIKLLEHVDLIYPHISCKIINIKTINIVYILWLKNADVDNIKIKEFCDIINKKIKR